MSIIGILSSNLFSAGAAQNTQSSQNTSVQFQQIKTEFQQLGQDLQSGNLTQAQSDFTTLSQNLSAVNSKQRRHRQARHRRQRDRTGIRPVGAGSAVRELAGGAARLHKSSTRRAADLQSTGRRTSRPSPSPHGKRAVFRFVFPADQSDQPGFQHAGARFAGGKSFGSSIGFFDAAERSSANRRFPPGGIERSLQHGCAVEYRQPECDRLISGRVSSKIIPILIRPCGLRYTRRAWPIPSECARKF